MKSKIHEYPGAALTVTFDSARCIHAARCVAGLPGVFDVDARPWVRPDNADAEQVVAVVSSCPSGALAVRPAPASAGENVIEVQEDGPLYVRGRLTLAKLSGEISHALRGSHS